MAAQLQPNHLHYWQRLYEGTPIQRVIDAQICGALSTWLGGMRVTGGGGSIGPDGIGWEFVLWMDDENTQELLHLKLMDVDGERRLYVQHLGHWIGVTPSGPLRIRPLLEQLARAYDAVLEVPLPSFTFVRLHGRFQCWHQLGDEADQEAACRGPCDEIPAALVMPNPSDNWLS